MCKCPSKRTNRTGCLHHTQSAHRLAEATGQRCLPVQMDVRKVSIILLYLARKVSYFRSRHAASSWTTSCCQYYIVHVHLLQYASVEEGVVAALRKFGKLDILINGNLFGYRILTHISFSSLCSAFQVSVPILFSSCIGAAGNFICPAGSMSSNAFRTGQRTKLHVTIIVFCRSEFSISICTCYNSD